MRSDDPESQYAVELPVSGPCELPATGVRASMEIVHSHLEIYAQ